MPSSSISDQEIIGDTLAVAIADDDIKGNSEVKDPDQNEKCVCENEQSVYEIFVSRYGGIIMALCASFIFSLSFLSVKVLNNYGFKALGSAVIFNCGIILPCSIAILLHEIGPGAAMRQKILHEIWPLTDEKRRKTFFILLIQGSLQGLSIILRSFSLRYLSFGDMTVIVFSSPVVTNFLAHILVGEKCGWIFILAALLTFTGVCLVTKPPILTGAQAFDNDTLIGSGLALGAMLTLSMKFAVTRKIKDTHYLLMSLFLGLCGLVLSLPLYLIFEEWSSIVPKGLNDTLLVCGLFITAFLCVVCINIALKKEDAGPIALVRSCDVIFAFLFQFMFLGVIPNMWSVIGAIVVVSGVFLTAIRKWSMSRKVNKEEKK